MQSLVQELPSSGLLDTNSVRNGEFLMDENLF